jgi:hypothetical protein
MPRIMDYKEVLQSLTGRGLVSLYFNSGAFGFARDAALQHAGWILQEDPTIRPAARELARVIAGDESTLAKMASRVIEQQGVWVMPKSHWAYELDFGSTAWLPGALESIGVDAASLIKRHDGAAIEFSPAERLGFESLIAALLKNLAGSDFMFVTANARTICTVHHHKQLWWTSLDADTIEAVKAMM